MINLTLEILLPLWRDRFTTLFTLNGKYSKHVAWELNSYADPSELFVFQFLLKTKSDHAGLTLDFGLLGLRIEYLIYDTRHWNTEENRWYFVGKEQW